MATPIFDEQHSNTNKEHKSAAFLCQDVRGEWHENTLDHTKRILDKSVYRSDATCTAAQKLTSGSTQNCVPSQWAPPFWAQDKKQASNRDRVTHCGTGQARGGHYSM